MTFPLACPHCENLHRELQRDALAERMPRFLAECSWCLRDQRTMRPVRFIAKLDQTNEGPLGPFARRSMLHHDAEFFMLATDWRLEISMEPTPFHHRVACKSVFNVPPSEPDYRWPDFVGLHSPEERIVPVGSLGSLKHGNQS